jgi:hypothetical protein
MLVDNIHVTLHRETSLLEIQIEKKGRKQIKSYLCSNGAQSCDMGFE